ncbi:MAG: tetratricopeptide repeat protein [Rubrivivax sp.]|nr:tetratricopeptide repeat protein [Rubrivivax sp.]
MSTDQRGNPISSASAAARDSAERALWRMMSFYDTPLADLDDAIEADPDWGLPRLMKAGFLLSLTEPSQRAEAAAQLSAARELEGSLQARERAHLHAVDQVMQGRLGEACRTWDELLLEYPRDALALQWAHLWDFHRGDAQGLRLRPARALPDWDTDDPLAAYVWALYAFGLEECRLYGQAEDAGRHALSLNPRVPWAMHAVAHVMEMQGRFEEGAAWLRQHQASWSEGNGFATHLWWHKALFRLESLDVAGVLRLLDKPLAAEHTEITLQRLDVAALLWRLHLLGHDVSAAFRQLRARWPMPDEDAGHSAFNDLHALLALLGSGEVAAAEAWVARCAERAMDAGEARRLNHAVAREVGLPLMRALLAFGRGEPDVAAQALYPARHQAQRCGGSHAQRDLIDQTLLAAAAQGSAHTRQTLGRALINERLLAKPLTPLTRHWVERLGFNARAASG